MMKRIVFFSFWLLSVNVSARTEVSFGRDIEVSDHGTLTWADLVTVKDGSSALFTELAGIEYKNGGAPEIRAQLRERKLASDVFENVSVVIPQDIAIKKVQGYSAAEFGRKVLPLVQAACADCHVELRAIRDSQIRLANDWKIGDLGGPVQSNMLIPVTSKGLSAWIPVQLKIQREVIVLKRSIPSGQKINAEDFTDKVMDVGALREVPATAADLGEAVAAHTLGTGQILTLSDVKREDFVKRGQPVKVVTGSDDFEVSVNATAEDNGRMGDVVKVKTMDSGKLMSAVVNGRGQVRLQ